VIGSQHAWILWSRPFDFDIILLGFPHQTQMNEAEDAKSHLVLKVRHPTN